MATETADETRRMLRDSVAAYVTRSDAVARRRRLRGARPGFERAAWREMAEAGWFGIAVPETLGGLGLGFGELAVVMEEVGRGLVPEPVGPAAVLALSTLVACGDGVRVEETVGGALVPALAWQERENVYEAAAPATTAREERGHLVLDGVKRFVPDPEGVDGFVVSAAGPSGPALYWVDAETPGIRVETTARVDGGLIGSVRLESARIAAEQRIAGPETAAAALARAVDEARLAAAAELLGVMERALEMTIAFVKERVQFGRPIGSFQALQHRMVDLWIQQELARSSLMDACAVFDRTEDARERAVAASAAKARAGDAALLVTRQAIQLHGGMGYTDEADIGLYLKRALVLSAWLGNAAAMRRRFAETTEED